MQNGPPPHETPTADQNNDQLSLWDRFTSQFHMRPPEDDEPQSWWIASTAIPLVAAAAGPLANLMSIVALVMPWRSIILSTVEGDAGNDPQTFYSDPHWVTGLNAVSLACGIVGNAFLLLNFTQTVRYIVALPVTIILWFLATGLLAGLTSALSIYDPPIPPNDTYSEAYWSAVIAAILYFILSVLLMINMLGYFLGRYPQHFSLTDDQRTLILQMTVFVAWLLIGAAFFQKVLEISFADALYFCDITVLTLGFGDVVAQTDLGRGLVWPYAVIGIIMLGLVVGSIHQFAREVHYDNVVRKHIENKRQHTFDRSITFDKLSSTNPEKTLPPALDSQKTSVNYRYKKHQPIRNTIHALSAERRPKLLIMREEKDRFDAMRGIQHETMRFRRWNDLFISIIAYGIVWSCGAAVFWSLEGWTYFEALYFCFCSLITIGYGDFTPKSNAGRPFFVVWSLIAIPTMTMLISQMSDTVVAGYKHGTVKFAEYSIMPESGSYQSFFARFPPIRRFLEKRREKKRLERGFQVGADPLEDTTDPENGQPETSNKRTSSLTPSRTPRTSTNHPTRTLEELARDTPSPYELAQQLAFAIRHTTQEVRQGKRKRYTYEEWVEHTRLIQFTNPRTRPSSAEGSSSQKLDREDAVILDEDEYGVLNWDWIGENSPMLAHQTEPEWVLDRLCESLVRYVSTQEQARARERGHTDEIAEAATLKKEKDLGIEEP
ncbi:hypothetical protein N7466_002484 [Penicillium verhagenii]|uniref:uncharacterized protein n=1 Tax=Penicillium verhagenii TaxID=1562060 RepID=UPI002545B555|nr:uncharacterized protein N7466_002484 [Penicillium verhagenii]KAJ5939350.1 hypothetical protein N7466_002484 [Penicillium verhagenii]